ncbi:hypothetical protein DS2_09837 [Catenovulum agarivorans DS-2]|uniref:Lipoprotein n=1 Tax=Catenovulum agarivorans DS-2 TaxID=1328313 RepID=W7QBC2_9ALTE|nr:hypothetical protein [Catenovulum agarivorans]EWH10084.1 hypothetical protein DS2_09837 [Catenovulum agarivorans DS-2]
MNKRLLKSMQYCCCVLLALPMLVGAVATRFQDQGERTFTLVEHHKYQRMQYQDVVLSQFDTKMRDVNEGADRQLVQFLSALRKDDFDWWLTSWNQATLQDWQSKAALKKARRVYNFWRATFTKQSVAQLKDFILMGQYVLIGVQIDSEYHLLPFELENGRWRIDQAYMNAVFFQKLKERLTKEQLKVAQAG